MFFSFCILFLCRPYPSSSFLKASLLFYHIINLKTSPVKELYFRQILKFQRTRIKIIVSLHEARVTSVIYHLPDPCRSEGIWKVNTQMLDLAYDYDREKLRMLIDSSQPGTKTEFALAVSDAARARHARNGTQSRKQCIAPISISDKMLIRNIRMLWNIQ